MRASNPSRLSLLCFVGPGSPTHSRVLRSFPKPKRSSCRAQTTRTYAEALTHAGMMPKDLRGAFQCVLRKLLHGRAHSRQPAQQLGWVEAKLRHHLQTQRRMSQQHSEWSTKLQLQNRRNPHFALNTLKHRVSCSGLLMKRYT